MRRISMLLAVGLLVSCLQVAVGEIITFNKSANAPGDPVDDQAAEAAYVDALALANYLTFEEQFTGSEWDSVRSSITLGTHSATSITSQGIDWHSTIGDFITTSSINSNNQAPWQIYSKETATGGLHAVPATIIGDSTQTLYGIGMWVSGSFNGKLNLIFDGDTANPVKFQRVIGFENNDPNEPIKETIRLNSTKQFFGVVVTEGFNTFQLLEVEGVLEDQKLMWAADFTFAIAAVLGDANGDGVVNNFDIMPFVQALTDAVGYAAAFPGVDPNVVLDLNDDGVFDNFDIAPFVAALTGP